MPRSLEVFDRNAEMACGSYGDVFLGLWRTAVTVDGARRVAVPMERLALRHPRGLSLLFVTEEECAMPDGEARKVFASDAKRHETFTRHMALVFEGEGFKASVFRSVLTGMQALTRQKAPVTVLATVAQAGRWLASQRPGELSAGELVAAFADFRAASRA